MFDLEKQVTKLEIETIKLGLLVESTISCRAPSPHYNMLLRGKFDNVLEKFYNDQVIVWDHIPYNLSRGILCMY